MVNERLARPVAANGCGLYPASMAGEPALEDRNAAFWDELCGTNLARTLGINDASEQSLARFDEAYFALYPYLLDYFPRPTVEGQRLLEIGLGYGTLGEALARLGANYHGLDIAAAPVAMMRARLGRVPGARPEQVAQGSVLELPFDDASFDHVVSIGCLHHTGDLFGAVAECRRVLRPGGRLVAMVYNRRSARRVLLGPVLTARHRLLSGAPSAEETLRYFYDGHADGDVAPHTDFVSVAELRGLLSGFRDVRVERRSIDRVPLGPIEVSRLRLMRLGVDRLVGLDLYAVGYR
jgi:SAM-dependent methyltransferase